MGMSKKYFWMVQKGKRRRIWNISSSRGLVSFISFSLGLSFFQMLVLTLGGLGMRLVLLDLHVGHFITGVLPKSVTPIASEFNLLHFHHSFHLHQHLSLNEEIHKFSIDFLTSLWVSCTWVSFSCLDSGFYENLQFFYRKPSQSGEWDCSCSLTPIKVESGVKNIFFMLVPSTFYLYGMWLVYLI